jgi:CRP-like cAMP-binding protein
MALAHGAVETTNAEGVGREYLPRWIEKVGVRRTVPANSTLALEGAPARSLYLVTSGIVRCLRLTDDGRRHICRFARAGDVIGHVARSDHSHSAEAVVVTTLISVPVAEFDHAAAADPRLMWAMLATLSADLEDRERLQLRLSRLSAEERVAAFLLDLASPNGGGEIAMSRLDIADHLGLTLETVSRALNSLKRGGMIGLIGAHRFSVRHVCGMQRLANGDRDAGRAA